MNDEARTELDRILALEPAALTDADRAVLSARRDYLSEDQRAAYGVDAPVEAEAEGEGASTEAPTRRGRRASTDAAEQV